MQGGKAGLAACKSRPFGAPPCRQDKAPKAEGSRRCDRCGAATRAAAELLPVLFSLALRRDHMSLSDKNFLSLNSEWIMHKFVLKKRACANPSGRLHKSCASDVRHPAAKRSLAQTLCKRVLLAQIRGCLHKPMPVPREVAELPVRATLAWKKKSTRACTECVVYVCVCAAAASEGREHHLLPFSVAILAQVLAVSAVDFSSSAAILAIRLLARSVSHRFRCTGSTECELSAAEHGEGS